MGSLPPNPEERLHFEDGYRGSMKRDGQYVTAYPLVRILVRHSLVRILWQTAYVGTEFAVISYTKHMYYICLAFTV